MNQMQMEANIVQVPIEDIIPNRFQPRLSFSDEALHDLAASIKQHGIIQPLVLRRKNDKYEIIAGERRYKAARMAGLASVPAIITNLDDNESAEVAIVENVQRKDLTAIEEAKSYQALLDKGYMTQEDLARKMGLSQSAIANKLRLLNLDEAVQEAVMQEKISERHARTLLKITDNNKQKELLKRIIEERLTVKQLEEEVRKMGSDGMQELEEVPIISNGPDIGRIVNNSVDITAINKPENIEETSSEPVDIKKPEEPVKTPTFFNQAPQENTNKFFNFLEDTAVNMNAEPLPSFDLPTVEIPKKEEVIEPIEQINQTDNIEMLDDFFIPTKEEEKPKNSYLDEVITTIRGLNLDSTKATISEMNLPTEYQITIKIKKDEK